MSAPALAGRAVVWNRIPTCQPVAFVTIDDGYNTPLDAAEYVESTGLPVTLFLSVNANAVFEHPEYFRRFLRSGQVPQSHGDPHDDLRGKPYFVQFAELSHARTELTRIYGSADPDHPIAPQAFRPPYGLYDSNTLLAARAVGHKWLIRWSHELAVSEVRNAQHQPDDRLACGDILLCHFDTNLRLQLEAAVSAIEAAGLRPAWLVDYLIEYPT